MPQGRLFSYGDAHRYRFDVNHHPILWMRYNAHSIIIIVVQCVLMVMVAVLLEPNNDGMFRTA